MSQRRRARRKRVRERISLLEGLESRQLLASDFQNAFNAFDVNDDGLITSSDVLGIVNSLNREGPGQLPAGGGSPPFVDTTGDGFRSSADALRVINELNRGVRRTVIAARENSQLAAENNKQVELPVAAGTRTLEFDFRTRIESPGDDDLADVINVYLVDASTGESVLGDTDEPLVSVAGQVTTLVSGIVSQRGERVAVDLTSVPDLTEASLLLQVLGTDESLDSRAVILNVTLEAEEAVDAPLTLADRDNEQVVSGPALDLTSFQSTSQLADRISAPQFNAVTGSFVSTLRVKNEGPHLAPGLAAVVDGLPAAVTLLNASGETGDGLPYINLAAAIGPGGFPSAAVSQPLELEFSNPANVRFPLAVEFLSAGENSPPALSDPGPLSVGVGSVLQVSLEAVDPEGSPPRFSILAVDGQPELPTMQLVGSELSITPGPGDEGTYAFLIEASDGIEAGQQQVALTVPTDADSTTRVSGVVLDVDGSPIPGIRIDLGSKVVTTDDDGRFELSDEGGEFDSDTLRIHGEDFAGPQSYPFVAEKLDLMFNRPLFDGAQNEIARPIFLPKLDVANGTEIDPNADTTVSQEIAPGDMAAVFIASGSAKDQSGNDFTGVLSITEVPLDRTPAALPDGLLPDTVVTIQPGELTFLEPAPLTLPNRSNLPPGTPTVLYSINPVTGAFDKVGKGQVTADGQSVETIEGGVRNSSWHFSLFDDAALQRVLAAAAEQQNWLNGLNIWAGKQKTTSSVELHSGALQEDHQLASYQSVGETRQWSLVYDSLRADPRHIVHRTLLDASGGPQDRITMNIRVNRGPLSFIADGARDFQGVGLSGDFGFHFWSYPAGTNTLKIAQQVDLADHPSGVYTFVTRVGEFRSGSTETGNGRLDDVAPIPVVHINGQGSPFGPGWGLAGLETIVEEPDGSVLLINGDGSEMVFDPPTEPDGPHVSPSGEFSVLQRQVDGSFTRTSPEQVVWSYDQAGRLVTHTDRNGNQTTFDYEGGVIASITDPAGLVTHFRRNAGRITEIEDPAGRITTLEYGPGGRNLAQIVDPDGSSRQFEYDDRHHMTAEVTKRGFREEIDYGFHGRVIRSTKTDGRVIETQATQTEALLPPGRTLRRDDPPLALISEVGAETRSTDENGNVIVAVLDAAGQIVQQRDSLGPLARNVRNDANLISQSIDARGNIETFEYDDLGNLVRRQDALAAAAQLAPTEAFAGQVLRSFAVTTEAAASGDVNGDGIADVVLVGRGADSRLTVFTGRGNGEFTLSEERVLGQVPQGIGIDDFNGDGVGDVLLLAATQTTFGLSASQLHVFTGMNGGDLAGPITSDTGGLFPGFGADDLEVADINGDGSLDVVTIGSPGTRNGTGLSILLGDGTGNFEEAQHFDTGTTVGSIAVADFNSDGMLDVVGNSFSTNEAVVGFGDGTGQMRNALSLETASRVNGLDAADVTRDGIPDVVVTLQGYGLQTFTSDGLRGFTGGDVFNVNPDFEFFISQPNGVTLQDMTGDGLVDALITHTERIELMEGDGQGNFAPPQFLHPGLGTTQLITDDFNQDDKADFGAVMNLSFSTHAGVAIVLGVDGQGRFNLPTVIDTPPLTRQAGRVPLATGEFNSDGLPDIVFTDNSANGVNLLLGTGGDVLTPGPTNEIRGSALVVNDFDQDGNDDIVSLSGVLQLHLGRGDGTFGPAISQPGLPGGLSNPLAFTGEFDGRPSTPDIALYDGRNRLVVFGGLSDGNLDEPVQVQLSEGARAFAVADLDNDGTDEFVFGTTNSPLRVVSVDDAGTFVEQEISESVTAFHLGVGDMTGDGRPDIVFSTGRSAGGSLGVLAQLADGSFAEPQLTPAFISGESLRQAAAGDFNLDGHVDMLFTDADLAGVVLAAGAGDGTFLDVTPFIGSPSPDGVLTADLDVDGDLDFVTVTSFSTPAESNPGLLAVRLNASAGLDPGCGDGPCSQLFTYDQDFNQLTSLTTELGARTLYILDPATGNRLAERRVVNALDADASGDDIVTTFTYTPAGLLETSTDPLGRVSRQTYDPQGRVMESIFAEGTAEQASLRFEYDLAGNVTATIDELGRRSEIDYDALNRPIRQRDALGNETILEYDAAGNLVKLTDARGNIVENTYDSLDRLTVTTDALGQTLVNLYDGVGNLIATTDERGTTTRFEYDVRNRQTVTTDGLGGVERRQYDADNNLISVTDPRGNATQFVVDARDRVFATIDPLGFREQTAYDLSDRVVAEVDALGNTESSRYDSLDRVVAIEQANGAVFEYEYDKAGNLVVERDPLGRETRSEFDARDRLVAATDAAGNRRVLTYDAAGNLATETDQNGNTTAFEYDPLNRLVQTTDPLDGVSTREYDEVGNLVADTNARGNTTRFTYDALDRLMQVTDPLGGTVTSTYDATDNLTSVTDALGRVTRFRYDGIGRLVETVDPGGFSVSSEYDNAGNLVASTDARGNTTRFEFDARDLLVSATDPLGGVSRYEYDAARNSIATTDRNGQTERQEYDELNRLVREIDPLGGVTTQTFDVMSHVVAETDANGNTITYRFDELSRVIETTDPLGGTTVNQYDPVGNLVAATDPLGRTYRFEFDALNRQVGTVDPEGNRSTTEYDEAGNVIRAADAKGQAFVTEFDELNRRIRVTDAAGGLTQFAYDAASQVIQVTDALGREQFYHYDDRGNQVRFVNPDGDESQFEYDGNGNLVTETDQLGNRSLFTYDANDRQVTVTNALGSVTEKSYDPEGNLLSLTDASGNRTSFAYDEVNRLIRKTDALGGETSYGFDAFGNLVSQVDTLGREIQFEYDGFNRAIKESWVSPTGETVREINTVYNAASQATSISDPDASFTFTYTTAGELETTSNEGTLGFPTIIHRLSYDETNTAISLEEQIDGTVTAVTNYQRDPLNRISRVTQSGTLASEKRVDFEFDVSGQMTSFTRFADLDGSVPVATTSWSVDQLARPVRIEHLVGGSVVDQVTTEYDAGGRAVRRETDSNTTQFTYDALGQVITAAHTSQPDESFEFDATGNRQGADTTVGAANRLEQSGTRVLLHDSEGNRVRETDLASGEVTDYTYDHRNRMVSATRRNGDGVVILEVQYRYDFFDRIIARTVDRDGSGPAEPSTELYVWDEQQLSLVLAADGTPIRRVLTGQSLDFVLAEENLETDETSWMLQDALNNVIAVIASDGTVLNRISYDVFGNVVSEQNAAVDQLFSFAGRTFDEDLGLYSFRARFYDASTGLFMREDPLGFDSGDANLYRYVFNSPANAVDPTGLKCDGFFSCLNSGLTAVGGAIRSGQEAIVNVGTEIAKGVGTVAAGVADSVTFGASTYLIEKISPETGRALRNSALFQGASLITDIASLALPGGQVKLAKLAVRLQNMGVAVGIKGFKALKNGNQLLGKALLQGEKALNGLGALANLKHANKFIRFQQLGSLAKLGLDVALAEDKHDAVNNVAITVVAGKAANSLGGKVFDSVNRRLFGLNKASKVKNKIKTQTIPEQGQGSPKQILNRPIAEGGVNNKTQTQSSGTPGSSVPDSTPTNNPGSAFREGAGPQRPLTPDNFKNLAGKSKQPKPANVNADTPKNSSKFTATGAGQSKARSEELKFQDELAKLKGFNSRADFQQSLVDKADGLISKLDITGLVAAEANKLKASVQMLQELIKFAREDPAVQQRLQNRNIDLNKRVADIQSVLDERLAEAFRLDGERKAIEFTNSNPLGDIDTVPKIDSFSFGFDFNAEGFGDGF